MSRFFADLKEIRMFSKLLRLKFSWFDHLVTHLCFERYTCTSSFSLLRIFAHYYWIATGIHLRHQWDINKSLTPFPFDGRYIVIWCRRIYFLKFKWYSYNIIYSHTIIQMLICVNQYLITCQVVSCHKLIYAYFHKHIVLKTLSFPFITKRKIFQIGIQFFAIS